MKVYDILIIGGGAAGLAAAVSAIKQNKNIKICVVEKNDRVAKKIHATGNGRCNFTNMDIKSDYFYGNKAFIENILSQFGTDEAVNLFEELGIMHRVEDGRVYPMSNQASAVADCLRLFLSENGVEFATDTCVMELKKTANGFCAGNVTGKRVIVATGGKAAANLGSDGSGYKILKAFGHTLSPLKPALVSLKTETGIIKGLKGVKAFAHVKLMRNNKELASDEGEILFTDYGVSGIPVMQISRFAEKGTELFIDMLPRLTREKALEEIYRRVSLFPDRDGTELFSGMVNKKLAVPMLRYAGIEKMNVKAKNFTAENIRNCGEFLKELKLTVLGDNGFINAQVSAGGIELEEFNPVTMESKKEKGLYAAGEILNCDGICGGYNLHWAWATGVIAGKNAAL